MVNEQRVLFRCHCPAISMPSYKWPLKCLFQEAQLINIVYMIKIIDVFCITGGILFSPEKAVEEVSHVLKTAF